MQVMLLQYAHLVLELRQQLPSAHERPEQIPAKLDALRSAISVSTPQHRPAAVTLDAGFGQRALKLATPSGGPISMMHGGHSSDAVQAELQQRPPTPPLTHSPTHSTTHSPTHCLPTVAGGAGAAAATSRGSAAAGGAAADGGGGGVRRARPGLRRALARPRPAEAAGRRRWAAAPAAALQSASLFSHCRASPARPAGPSAPPAWPAGSPEAEGPGRHPMPPRRALEEAQSLAVQQGEVSKLTQRQLEAAQLQVTARQRQLEAQSLEAERAGEQAADTHVALQAPLTTLLLSTNNLPPATCYLRRVLPTDTHVALQAQIHALQSELQQARSAVDESRSQLELSRSQAAGSDARTLQQAAELADAQQRAAAAESELIAAEAETRHALPQWQEQLQRAEAQLRDLGAQVKDKDAGLLREREERAREVGEARRRADAAEAEARRAVVAAAADGGRTDELQQQQRMAFERKDREVAALTQQLASLQADHGALQRAQQQLAADREVLHDRYNPKPEPNP